MIFEFRAKFGLLFFVHLTKLLISRYTMEQEHAFDEFLVATETMDYNHPRIQEILGEIPTGLIPKAKANWLYEHVRDRFLYDPYHLDLRPQALKASEILTQKRAWCVEKAIVLAACFRAAGIPAKLGFGIVVNHIGVEKLTSYLQREEIVFHGFVEAFVDGVWSKCTPAFDPRICRLSGVEPLAWNQRDDSLFQEFSSNGKFMEYIHFYGSFPDVPFALMHQEMQRYYPHLFEEQIETRGFSFHFAPEFLTIEQEAPVATGL
jgi:hypothetical protein